MAAAEASQIQELQQELDAAKKQIKKLESMRTFGEEFRKLMQQDAADYTEKAIENLQRQLALAIEALKNAMKALKHAQEKGFQRRGGAHGNRHQGLEGRAGKGRG